MSDIPKFSDFISEKVETTSADNYKKYKRTNVSEMRPYSTDETLDEVVSISKADLDGGSPKDGDMIARNVDDHGDQWLVAGEYFKNNFEEL